ncbi:MAG TPA: phosphatase PAP2 family protein [Chloroflexota bacterium]|nr:phosphatase PAP2 family protein [Chloroflexota bacterium]
MYLPATLCDKRPATAGSARRTWLYFCLQVALVVGLDIIDEVTHGLFTQTDVQVAETHALHVMEFESLHGFWVEPAIQGFFERTHHLLGLTIGSGQADPIFDAFYGLGHVGVTLLFAIWVFLRRRALFPFLRNVFLFTNGLALVLYRVYPLAPPRLALGLRYDGRPYHFVDTVFGVGKGIKLGFDQFAAMPSLHVAWALIVGMTLAWAARPLVVRLFGLVYPLIMLTTVIVTGNHYISDALGAVLVLIVAFTLAVVVQQWRAGEDSIWQTLQRLRRLRHATA